MTPGTVDLAGPGLSRREVVEVARDGAEVRLEPAAHEAMERAAEAVARLGSSEEGVYGISTGFGALADTRIPEESREAMQRSVIRSHAAGMGRPIEPEVVRAMMLLRTRSLAFGLSGTRPEVAERLVAMLNAGITPIVPEYGSLGASGDLAPLAHCALALMGEGEVLDPEGRIRPADEVLAEAGIEPFTPTAKEGLSLINGTDGILGMLILALDDFDRLLATADLTAAMSVEALLGTDRAFSEDIVGLRPQAGQAASALNMRRLLEGSPIVESHREGDPRVQDAYSLRCAPQVNGAAREVADWASGTADTELEAAIDNPVVLPDGRVESCGNFHGAPLANACDFLAIAAADVGAVSERRTDRLLDPSRSHGLPAFLADRPGEDSGLMIAHYTQAAMVEENRRLASPAGVDSLPTSAMQEDHVSMAWNAARKLRQSLQNLGRILAVELVVSARGLDLRTPLEPARGTGAVVRTLRERVEGPGPDRYLAPDLAAAEELVGSGSLLVAAEQVTGPLD